jgi:hypothetical protein
VIIFSIESDIPRELGVVQEGIEANLGDLIESDLSDDLNPYKYVDPTSPTKTYKALTKVLFNSVKNHQDLHETKVIIQKIMNSKWWIITFVTEVSDVDYEKECNRLTDDLASALEPSHYDFRLCEDDRSGEGLSLRYVFKLCPADGPLEGPPFPDRWEVLELEPFSEIYPDSDPNEMYEI